MEKQVSNVSKRHNFDKTSECAHLRAQRVTLRRVWLHPVLNLYLLCFDYLINIVRFYFLLLLDFR